VIDNLKRLRRTKIRAVAGELLNVNLSQGSGREEAMRQTTDEIMCRIAAMLPESYRDFMRITRA